jgi:NTP pyrophosphatase (non-canonical NTP hydrolase)
VGRLQLDEYVSLVPAIYGKHDLHRSIWDVWCHTLHHGAAVAERIRKEAPADDLFTEIADLALWLFTSIQKLTGKPGKRKFPAEAPSDTLVRIRSRCSDLVWHRYPRICHLCYARRIANKVHGSKLVAPCDCFGQKPDRRDKEAKRADLKALRRFSESIHSRKPKSIDEWQVMFGTVFGANIHRLSPTEIGFHLLEELGEASDAMARMYSYSKKNFRFGEPNWRRARLEDQIADALSWLFALVQKLNAMKFSSREVKLMRKNADMPRVTLSEIIWRRYGSESRGTFRCPVCNGQVCSCPLIFIPGTHAMDDLFRKLDPRMF